MAVNNLEYSLENGYIHHWLVAGPQAIPVLEKDDPRGENENQQVDLRRQYHNLDYIIKEKPVEREYIQVGETQLRWHHRNCHPADHFTDVSTHCPSRSYVRVWAYTRIRTQSPFQATFVLTTNVSADVWLNGMLIYSQDQVDGSDWQSSRFKGQLVDRENELLVRFEQAGIGECALTMACQVLDLQQDIPDREISIPIPTPAHRPSRYQRLEKLLEYAYLEQVVNHRGNGINLRWAEDLEERFKYCYQIQDVEERIYVEGDWDADPNTPLDIGHPTRLFERPFWVVLKALGLEYYEQELRYQKALPIYVLDNAYSASSYGSLYERNREALEDAKKYPGNIFAEIAKMELGRWSDISNEAIIDTINRIVRHDNDSLTSLLGLIGINYRYRHDPSFPEVLVRPIQDCILNYPYDLRTTDNSGSEEKVENKQLLEYTAQYLAGQLYPRRTFKKDNHSGQSLRVNGKSQLLEWIKMRGKYGFQDWDSNSTFETILMALSHITSLTKNGEVSDLAAILMDKLFFSMALNSYKGTFGCSHGRTYSSMLKSSQLEATSGISRMMWGMGVYNPHILGTVSLACSNYEFPLMIGDIANQSTDDILNKEQKAGNQGEGVNTVTYKTPEYMLSSVQDYRPGQRGSHEHIWQATMGSEAIVFTSHPACVSESNAHRPGFWLGNVSLPRVAQWKDVLVAIYRLPENDWMGFTHAYFPIYAFDEYEIKNGWAFARKEDGFLAITASKGFELIRRSPDSYRELRSNGKDNVWICHMGRKSTETSFTWFQKRILAMEPEFQDRGLSFTTLRGEHLSFAWDAPLIVNGQTQPLTGYKHYDNPYCTADYPVSQMEIKYGDVLARYNFT